MKTINMKRIFLCLIIGISYLTAHAQGIVVYKTDGTQIKVPYEQLDSIATYLADDNPVTPPDPSVQPVTVSDLEGVWEDGGQGFGNGYTMTFAGDQVTVEQEGEVAYQGAYTLSGNVVSFVMGGTTYRSAAGLAGGQSVLIMKEVYADEEEGTEQEELSFYLVKRGKTVSTKKEDIQGQWLWWMDFNTEDRSVRMSYKFEGDNFEIIIVPWGQRYTGTYTYENGIVTLTTTAGYTSREEGTGDGWGEGDLDPVTLEGNWKPLNQDRWYAPEGGPFFVVGDEAYCMLLMPSICKRKK